jgi:lysozyme family protein
MNFDAARIAYLADGWDEMEITRDRAEMESDAKIVLAHKKIYIDIENVTGVPWWFLAVVDMREGGIGNLGTRHLHNGDRLTGYTVRAVFAGLESEKWRDSQRLKNARVYSVDSLFRGNDAETVLDRFA